MTETKLCKNCKHVDIRYTFYDCMRPILSDEFTLVSGKPEIRPLNYRCVDERTSLSYTDTCGPEGKYFERKTTFWEWIQDTWDLIRNLFYEITYKEK